MWTIGPYSSSASSGIPLYYSNYNQPLSFNTVTQVLDCGTSNSDQPTGLRSLESLLVIFKMNSLWVCYGDTQNDFVTRKVSSIGCISKGSIAAGYSRVFYLSSDGVYSYDGQSAPQNISDGSVAQGSIRTVVDTILAQQFFNNNETTGTQQQTDVTCSGFVFNRSYYLSVYSAKGTFTNVTYVYDLLSGGWTVLPYGSSAIGVMRGSRAPQKTYYPTGTNANYSISSQWVFAANQANLQIDQWFAAETDYGNPIASNWTTGISDSGAPYVRKQYRYIEVIAPNQPGSSCQITLTVDPGADANVFGPYTVNLGSGPCRHRISIPQNCTGYEAQLTIAATTTQKTIIDRVAVLGYVKSESAPNVGNA